MNMKVLSITISKLVTETTGSLMVTDTKETLLMEYLKVMEHISIQMEEDMKANGKLTFGTDKADILMRMAR